MRFLRLVFVFVVLGFLAVAAPVGMAMTLFISVPFAFLSLIYMAWGYFGIVRKIPSDEEIRARSPKYPWPKDYFGPWKPPAKD